jgi:tripartite-type tricarboxylate transporter receptor subunit TctC
MGFPNIYADSWIGFFAPIKTPDAVVTKLNAEINALMIEPYSLEILKKAPFDPVVKSVAAADSYFKSEVENWGMLPRPLQRRAGGRLGLDRGR